MEIVENNIPRHIGIKLDFLKPFKAHNVAEFTFEPLNDLDSAMSPPSPGRCTVPRPSCTSS